MHVLRVPQRNGTRLGGADGVDFCLETSVDRCDSPGGAAGLATLQKWRATP